MLRGFGVHLRKDRRLPSSVVPGPVLTTAPMILLFEHMPTAGTEATLQDVVARGPLLMPNPVMMIPFVHLEVTLLRTGVITW